jgi:hypothetical protein
MFSLTRKSRLMTSIKRMKWCALAGEGHLHLFTYIYISANSSKGQFFNSSSPLTMAENSEKQQPPDADPANQANQGYPASTTAPNVVNDVPQPVAVTGQQYRDQCK